MSDAAPAAPAAGSQNPGTTPPEQNAEPSRVIPNKAPKAKPVEAGVPPADAKPAEEFFEIVIDGKPKRLSKEQAIRKLQKEEAGDRRFQQAAELAKKAQAVLGALQGEQAEQALEQLLGERLDAIAEQRFAKRIQGQLMTPEERERVALQQKLQGYEQAEQQRAAREQQTAREQQRQTLMSHFDKSLSALVDKAGLPAEPGVLETVAQVALEALDYEEAGVALTEDQLVAEIKERLETTTKERDRKIASGLKGDALLSYLGESTVQAVVDAVTAKYHAANPYQAPKPKEEPLAKVNPGESIKESDYMAWLKGRSGR
jgi:hypothetical protein